MNSYKKEFGELIEEGLSLECLVKWLEENDTIILSVFRSQGPDCVHNCQRFLKESVPFVMKPGVTYVRSPRLEKLIRDDLPERPVVIYSHDQGLYVILGLRLDQNIHLLYIIT